MWFYDIESTGRVSGLFILFSLRALRNLSKIISNWCVIKMWEDFGVPPPRLLHSHCAGPQLTTVSSLGEALFWSRTLMMCVWPCWAAWCSGVYPFCRRKNREVACTSWITKPRTLLGTEGEGPYLCLGINFRRMLQQKIDYFDVSIVTAHMERRVAHL